MLTSLTLLLISTVIQPLASYAAPIVEQDTKTHTVHYPIIPTAHSSETPEYDGGSKVVNRSVLAIVGAFAGFIALVLAYIIIHYFRTPARDRTRDIIDRHKIDEEMANIQRQDARLKEPVPPPPYIPRPPAYVLFDGSSSDAEGVSVVPPREVV
ncbi:hypothetical protein CYLTODRAFT_488676 [Cylindrobasidium torrendii FP15055 ss-10]|uniref:Transmembrane protein n=1 Tax=Cylindrobasidium torrendii FP15055 ss-10 TaxID=1314674 RepID=A0A0D7BGX4_9AGAR|nr:hypothetical protein CYLTODRAFT_488676 [Cylindrobasidium torrendii FP15055 ss-10]